MVESAACAGRRWSRRPLDAVDTGRVRAARGGVGRGSVAPRRWRRDEQAGRVCARSLRPARHAPLPLAARSRPPDPDDGSPRPTHERRLPVSRAAVRPRRTRLADPRPRRRARVVQAVEARGRVELPRRGLPGQARPHLVGRQDRAWARRGDPHHPRRELSRARARAGGPRPTVRPARVPAHVAWHGARHRVGARADEPLEHRRPRERRGDRRRRAGARAAERPRSLRVAQPRPRRDRRVACGDHDEGRVRLLPHQLDRARRRRQLPRLCPQHLGRSTRSTAAAAR